ncbi:hypothetical protein [Methanospirillum hungatei]|uniref:hypothetical protein n=1 Tax=Methanospirillum hungatei TaxID=2203 RepID=UPI00118113D9|nr:hypothetical protein [Methanospirillum hungatei]
MSQDRPGDFSQFADLPVEQGRGFRGIRDRPTRAMHAVISGLSRGEMEVGLCRNQGYSRLKGGGKLC